LGESGGFRRCIPTLIFAVGMVGLAVAMKWLPTGTAYAVCVGIGASLTVLWGIVTGNEAASPGRVLLLAFFVVSVAGLKVVS
jgi:quaternary ammonium compound-resistance protein SugE